ncbi:MAG: ribonuclease HII [Candidatus Omnitrophota bacterium]|nr:ribonuclease HII [Candidatus Omnitrophota bacterium]
MIVGIDEAGRGPLAGVVVGCALYLRKLPPFVVKDSKELSPLVREKIVPWLCEHASFSVGIATSEEIDKINILQATFLTFNRAIKGLLAKEPSLRKATFIVDGNLFRTKLDIKYICMEKADKKIKEVSCASIMAKVVRDYFMKLVDFLYPQWEFSQHKGYPTQRHMALLNEYPLTPFHRRSFSPCKR